MKRKVSIELYEEHEKVNFYTIRCEGEESEIEKFWKKFPEGCRYDRDINIIISWIDKIGEKGALERYFRPESKRIDNICAIPIETSKIRLYVIRLNDNIVILGNGDLKRTVTYNEDKQLSYCVELLRNVDVLLKTRINCGNISFYQKELFGLKPFYLNKTDEEK